MISIEASLPVDPILYNVEATISSTVTSTATVMQAELRLNGVTVSIVTTVTVGPYVFSHMFGSGYFHVEIYAFNDIEEETTLDLGFVNVMGPDSLIETTSMKLFDFSFGMRSKTDSTFSIANS
jgi:hypothetical protein